MKKILMVCSCLVLLLAFSVPTFAADVNDPYDLIGEWTLKDNASQPSAKIFLDFTVDGVAYDSITRNTSGVSLNKVGQTTGIQLDYGYGYWFVWPNANTPISAPIINITGGSSLTDEASANWLKANAVKTVPPSCDGSTCPATDINEDNICDDCGGAFTFNLRNDTYSFNGYYLPASIKDDSGAIVNLINYWHETLRPNGGNLVLLNGDNPDSALLYYFSPNVEYRSGNVVTTGNTSVTLYKIETDDNGNPYWYKSATDTWNTDGALVAGESHIDWVAEAVSNEEGIYQITGDVNFMTPLWEKVGTATQGEMAPMSQKIVGTMKILVACSVGLMACLVVLSLFGKRSLIFRS